VPSTVAINPNLKNDKKEIIGWSMYDWAISAFQTSVVTVFLGPYLTALVKDAADADGLVYVLSLPIKYDSFFAYCTSLSVFLQVFILPMLGAIADFSKRRKDFLAFFTVLGGLSTLGLFFLTDGLYWLGAALFILANLSCGAAMVFYNAYLPDIASHDQHDRVSSKGWGLGYLGGGLLLLVHLIFFMFKEPFGISTGMAVRLCLASAGLWWLLFAQFTFSRLRYRYAFEPLPKGKSYFGAGVEQIKQTLRVLKTLPETRKYLIAYLLYNDGVQTVIVVATLFGSEELKMESSTLIQVILMVQILAFGGAYLFRWLAARLGTKNAVVLSIIVWSGVVIYAWYFLQTPTQFWVMAAVVALVMGGSQALSRSLFAQMIPKGNEAAFFSVYELSERGTSWIGPLIFGLTNQLVGGLRYGILSLIVLFLSGLAILVFVDAEKARRDAEAATL
jgi:MFS transporter, UMF1 family